MLPTRDSHQGQRHKIDRKSEDEKRYFMKMEMTRKQGQQHSY